jgi:hypothetical protein
MYGWMRLRKRLPSSSQALLLEGNERWSFRLKKLKRKPDSEARLQPLDDPVEEAKRIVEAAESSKVTLRLLGGVAFHIRCPSTNTEALRRKYVDIDFMGHSKQSRKIGDILEGLGYTPRERFNAMHGEKRLIFNDLEHQRRVDVFLDVFEMCHKFNFKDRLEMDRYTITLADLLATKLQIVEMNQKDLRDTICMFVDHPISTNDEGVNGASLAKLCADDWGIYKTFNMNLDRLLQGTQEVALEDSQKSIAAERIRQLKSMFEEAPKSLRWKMRARVGEKVRWYNLPEVDQGVVDSRLIQGEAPGTPGSK